jgi:hypothetical protein
MSFNNIEVKTINWASYPPDITPSTLPNNEIPVGSGTIPPLKDSGASLLNNHGNLTLAPPSAHNFTISCPSGHATLLTGSNLIDISEDGATINDLTNNNAISTNSDGFQLKILGNAGATGDILTADGLGNASWQSGDPPSGPTGPAGEEGPTGSDGATGPAGGFTYGPNMYSDQSNPTVGAGDDYYMTWGTTYYNNNPTLSIVGGNKIQNNDSVLHYYLITVNICWANSGVITGSFDYSIIVNNYIDAYVATNWVLNGDSAPFHQQCSGIFPVNPGGGIQIYVHNGGLADTTLTSADSAYDNCVQVLQIF